MKFDKPEYGSKKIENLAKDLETSTQTIYREIQFKKEYPEFSHVVREFEKKLPSWRFICNEILPEHREDATIETPPLPEGKYNVIYADPPWDIGSIELEKWESPLNDKYPTLPLEEIKDLKDKDGKSVKELFFDNCSLFLWTTHTFLEKAFEVMENWGFKYHCCITWDKKGGWSANGFHRRTEFCLYGYKGKMNITQEGEFIPTLIVEQKTEHSKKPKIMKQWLISNTPKPRIELFSRDKNDDEFDTWGNEINDKRT